MIERAFGATTPFSLGVEEELMIVDDERLLPVAAVNDLIAAVPDGRVPGRLKTELFASVVELNTNVCASASDAVRAIAELRTAADALARDRGLRIAAAGAHPLARPEEQEIVDEPRYREMLEYVGPSARRQGVNGLHVHVGVPDADASLRALESVLPWLPVVLAIAANSPYVAGEETGMLSSRADLLALLPRNGAPPRFDSFDDWERFVESLTASGLVSDYTSLWWDVRPHPRFGTLEIRMPDQPTDVRLTGAFVALLQALVARAVADPPRRTEPGDRAVYQQNRWAAARFGPRAQLIHPAGGRLAPASELGAELLERVRPAAAELGSLEFLDDLRVDACEADRQLEIGRRDGVFAVCSDVVERTVRFAA